MLVGLALVLVGCALLGITLWFWRAARPDNPVLGPLEVLGERRFREADEQTRKEMLRQSRTTVEP